MQSGKCLSLAFQIEIPLSHPSLASFVKYLHPHSNSNNMPIDGAGADAMDAAELVAHNRGCQSLSPTSGNWCFCGNPVEEGGIYCSVGESSANYFIRLTVHCAVLHFRHRLTRIIHSQPVLDTTRSTLCVIKLIIHLSSTKTSTSSRPDHSHKLPLCPCSQVLHQHQHQPQLLAMTITGTLHITARRMPI